MLRPYTHEERVAKFGRFTYKPAPVEDNPEAIIVDPAWPRANIVTIELPWGRPHKLVRVHRLAASQISALWADWAQAGLLDRILTFNGSYVPRYKRGRTGSDAALSNHSWGTAFDLNAHWNRMGHPPATGKGSLLELVSACEKHGIVWGGTFKGSRLDAQHFEVGG